MLACVLRALACVAFNPFFSSGNGVESSPRIQTPVKYFGIFENHLINHISILINTCLFL